MQYVQNLIAVPILPLAGPAPGEQVTAIFTILEQCVQNFVAQRMRVSTCPNNVQLRSREMTADVLETQMRCCRFTDWKN